MSVEVQPVDASSHVFLVLYGDIGIGKTTVIGSGGKVFKTLIVRPPTDHVDSILGSGVEQIIVRDWEEIMEATDYIRHDGHKYDWVWIDSFTLLQDMGLRDVYKTVVEGKGGEKGKRAKYPPDRGEYRANMWRLEETVSNIVSNAGFNFGITAHAMWYEPDERNEDIEPYLYPMIHGSKGNFAVKVCSMMNAVGYMHLKKTERGGRTRTSRVISFDKSPSWYAKIQFKNDLPNGDLVNPTMPDLMKAIGRDKPAGRVPSRRPTGRGKRGPAQRTRR